MKRFLGGFALVALILGLSSEAASAQMAGFVNYPAIGGVGLKIFGDYGRGLNDNSGKGNYFGGRAELGIPIAQFWAGAGSYSPDTPEGSESSSEISWGGGAAFNIIKGPVAPIKLSAQAAVSGVSLGEGISQMSIPVGLAVNANLGTGGTSVVPWGYAYGQYVSVTAEGFDSINEWAYGLSGGLEVNLAMGLGFYGSMAWTSVKSTSPVVGDENRISVIIVGVGASYKIVIPSLGM
jgi:hypothetical protein